MSKETTEQFDYSSLFRETKGTKTIKVTKDVYAGCLKTQTSSTIG